MKKIIFFAFCFFNISSFSQSVKLEYVSFLKSDVSDYFNKELDNIVDENASKIKYSLFVNENESVFYSENILSDKNNKLNLLHINSKLNGTIYLDLKKKLYIQKKFVYGMELTIKDSVKQYSWELINNETKLIDSLICFKAIHKEIIERKFENDKNEIEIIKKEKITTAWYCPSININVGPLGFYGLPGLILILEDDIFVYQAIKIELNLDIKQKKQIVAPKAGRYLTNDEFNLEYNKLKTERENMLKN